MNTGASRSLVVPGNGRGTVRLEGQRLRGPDKVGAGVQTAEEESPSESSAATQRRTRVFVSAENRLLREVLSRMLLKRGDIDVVGLESIQPLRPEALLEENADILLMTSRGALAQDLALIGQVRQISPAARILLIGMTEDEREFLQYVRAGIKGYLPRNASSEDVMAAVRAVEMGESVCPGSLCAALFRYLEREATSLPSAAMHQRTGLTRREQQLVPLIAQGMTNKEIANHFCLSEQTVKNHLYRMKHKIGADGRLGIVQLCRTQGFVV
jgi:DNA-binding NarL/FixJ family response regulator